MDDKPIKVLLLEDDPLDREIFKQRLIETEESEDSPFQVEGVDHLQLALERLSKGNFDVIVADLHLPDSNGMKTVTSLREKARSTPIVVLTSLLNDALAMDMAKNGVQDYLVKTEIGQYSLLRTVRYACERGRLTQEKDKVNAELERLILLDPLTELFNRRGLERALLREIRWTIRKKSSLLAILLDLDDFKKINDTLGHAVGDTVLKEVARRLTKSVRSTDYVSRIGGDEFMVLLPEAGLADGLKIAEKISRAIGEIAVSSNSETFAITASFGVVQVTEGDVSIEELLKKADPMLGRSKKEGKNRISSE